MGYEEIARANHRNGNSCSASLFMAFADKLGMSEDEAAGIAPAPRSDGGKCGGFLAGRKLLEMLKPEVAEEFEKRFLERNGDNKCAGLILKRRLQGKNCNDLVGETASLIESLSWFRDGMREDEDYMAGLCVEIFEGVLKVLT